MKHLVVNSIIQIQDADMSIVGLERVLWVDPSRTEIVRIDIRDLTNLPFVSDYDEVEDALETSRFRLLQADPWIKFMTPTEEYVEKHKSIRDKGWAVISEIVQYEPDIYDERQRGRLVANVCKKHGIHPKVVYAYLKKYWIRGKIANGLLPDYFSCGSKGVSRPSRDAESKKRGRPRDVARDLPDHTGVNVTEADLRNIRRAIAQHYNTADENPWTFAYHEMLKESYSVGVYLKDGALISILPEYETVMSIEQFKYWGKKILDLEEMLRQRIGKRKYEMGYRQLKSNATQRAQGPGYVFEIDAMVADVYIVSNFDRNRIIGRPVVYIVKDVFSRMVAGVYVGLEGPNWIGAMMAIENTTADKVQFCAEYGITIDESEWPCHHLPNSFTADRGEMESANTDPMTLNLGSRVDNAPPYRADLKGIIEQHFRILNIHIKKFVPGEIRKEIRERGEPDYRLSAKLSTQAFTKIIIKSILYHNMSELNNYPMSRGMTDDHVPPVPLELWNWGITNESGYLQERDPVAVKLNLLPRAKASLTREGIYLDKRYYVADESLLKNWNEKVNGRKSLTICHDPRKVDCIYIPSEDGIGYITCRLSDSDERFMGVRIEEVQDQLHFEKVESALRKTDLTQRRAEMTSSIQHTVREEIEKTDAELDPNTSKASRVQHIRENRAAERSDLRREQAWGLNNEETAMDQYTADVLPFVRPEGDKPSKPTSSSTLALLRRTRDERSNTDDQ